MRENPSKPKTILSGLGFVLLIFVLNGCGQKGPLQRPAQSSAEFLPAAHTSLDKPVAQVFS
jgi:predicted small lipoprotein YifL